MRAISLLLYFLFATSSAFAQQAITRSSIDGGGGQLTSSRYTLNGSIGQHDAEPLMQGGRYRLGSGFWTAVNPSLFRDGFEQPVLPRRDATQPDPISKRINIHAAPTEFTIAECCRGQSQHRRDP